MNEISDEAFWMITAATFLGGWAPCAATGHPGVGVASGLLAIVCQFVAICLVGDEEP